MKTKNNFFDSKLFERKENKPHKQKNTEINKKI